MANQKSSKEPTFVKMREVFKNKKNPENPSLVENKDNYADTKRPFPEDIASKKQAVKGDSNSMRFKDLKIGDTFDFVDDSKPGYNSFFKKCTKTSNRGYMDSDGQEHQVGSINAQVFHVNEKRNASMEKSVNAHLAYLAGKNTKTAASDIERKEHLQKKLEVLKAKRDWKSLPSSFEVQAVNAFKKEIKPYLSKDSSLIKFNVALNRATSFKDIEDAFELWGSKTASNKTAGPLLERLQQQKDEGQSKIQQTLSQLKGAFDKFRSLVFEVAPTGQVIEAAKSGEGVDLKVYPDKDSPTPSTEKKFDLNSFVQFFFQKIAPQNAEKVLSEILSKGFSSIAKPVFARVCASIKKAAISDKTVELFDAISNWKGDIPLSKSQIREYGSVLGFSEETIEKALKETRPEEFKKTSIKKAVFEPKAPYYNAEGDLSDEPMFLVSKTYEVVTEESAAEGDAAERGFIFEDDEYSPEELATEIKNVGYSMWSDSRGKGWITSNEEENYRTGERTSFSLHFKKLDGSELSDEDYAFIDHLMNK